MDRNHIATKTCLPGGTLTHKLFQARETPFPGALPYYSSSFIFSGRFYLWCGNLTGSEFLGFMLDCLLFSVALWQIHLGLFLLHWCVIFFCFLWLEPSFNLADTWIVIVCSSSWSVSSAASEYRHKLRQAQLHCRNETHTRILVAKVGLFLVQFE